MKKIVINISENTYDKLIFESLREQKTLAEILKERIFMKPFHEEVEKAYEKLLDQQIEKVFSNS